MACLCNAHPALLLTTSDRGDSFLSIQTLNGISRRNAVAKLPVLKGTLDLLVLRALSWTPMHGFEIVSWLERAGDGSLDVEDSALYQAVYRLEERGLLEADWGVTENNRRARYYKLTTAGRAFLRAETKNWVQYADTVTTILTVATRDATSRSAS
jgi:transcriptional regulator